MNYAFDGFVLDAGKRLLIGADGQPIPLTPKVFDTLLYLVIKNGKVIEKDELMSAIWTDTIVEENNLNKNISVLRRLLGESRGEHRFIATVPGKGYKFVADVRVIANTPDLPDADVLPEHDPNRKFPISRPIFAIVLGAILLVTILAGSFYWRGGQTPVPNTPRTIAILPFRPLVAENRDEALELGMSDTLISRLGNNREIIVRPLSSVRGFGSLDQDAVKAGQALDAESVLEGNIQRWGDRIRVNVRLVKVTDGTSLWTDTFDEKFTDIFVVQDAIANRVAAALAFQLTGDEKTRLEKRYTNNSDAYAFYVRGRYHAYKATEANILKGIGFYEQAIQVDPKYALAYAGMADAYRTLASASFASAKDVCPRAKSLAEKAMQLDESLAEPHVVLGWLGFLFDRDWAAAEENLKRAIELSPNNSDAHRAYAHLLSNSGRHDEAIAEGRLASELSPLSLITLALESQFLHYAGRYQEAIIQASKTLDFDPDFWVAHNVLGRIYSRQERYSEAIDELTRARDLSGNSTEPLMQLGYALAKAGKREQAMAVITELENRAKQRFVSSYNFAMIFNGLGETEEALRRLQKSLDDREIQMAFLKVDSRWDNLRSESRFAGLIRQMQFPE